MSPTLTPAVADRVRGRSVGRCDGRGRGGARAGRSRYVLLGGAIWVAAGPKLTGGACVTLAGHAAEGEASEGALLTTTIRSIH